MREKLLKIGKGALIAGLGAVLTYALNESPNWEIPAAYLPLVTAALSVLVNLVRQFSKPQ